MGFRQRTLRYFLAKPHLHARKKQKKFGTAPQFFGTELVIFGNGTTQLHDQK